MSRLAYRQAVACFLDTAGKVQAEQWGTLALGVWSVRDLVGHSSRSITRVEEFGVQRAQIGRHHVRRPPLPPLPPTAER